MSNFRLDEYEVTVGRFRQFVTAWNGGSGYLPASGAGKHTHLNGGQGLANSGSAGTYEPGWLASDNGNIAPTTANLTCGANASAWTGSNDNRPINCVNWYEAAAFCIWDGGFLPSEAEWEYAAAGGSQQKEYPWGSTAPGTDNQYAIYNCYYDYDPGCQDGAGVMHLAPVGTATLGAGVWGQLDLAGSVNEWNLDWFATYVNPCADCANTTPASNRGIRGMSFWFDPNLSDLLPPTRSSLPPSTRDFYFGFRCARTP